MKKNSSEKSSLHCLGFLICESKLSTHCSLLPSPLPRVVPMAGGREFLLPKGPSSGAKGRGAFPTAAGAAAQLTDGSVWFALLSVLALCVSPCPTWHRPAVPLLPRPGRPRQPRAPLPNSSSMAMMISTWSKLSRPRSFMKWDSAVSWGRTRRSAGHGHPARPVTPEPVAPGPPASPPSRSPSRGRSCRRA